MKRTKKDAKEFILDALQCIFRREYTEEEKQQIAKSIMEKNPDLLSILDDLRVSAEQFNRAYQRLQAVVDVFRGVASDRPEVVEFIKDKDEAVDYIEDEPMEIFDRIKDAEAYKLGFTKIDWLRTERNIEKFVEGYVGDEITETTQADIIQSISHILSKVQSKETDNEPKVGEQCRD